MPETTEARTRPETCKEWLERAARETTNPDAVKPLKGHRERISAREADCRERGVKTRRSDWDVCAEGTDDLPPITEACERRGTNPPPNSVSSGVRPRSHRVPQTGKWGNERLKT